MTQYWEEFGQRKLIPPERLEEKVALLRKESRTIATINGSFDLLHAGHLTILHEASKQADILIVLLNTDSSIKQYKNDSRPIIKLKDRLQMISALGFIDYVSYFDDLDPIKMLSLIKPDVHVNGSEYGQDCIEAEAVKSSGGRIHIVSLLPGLSTSEIISKIQNVCV